MYLEKAFEGIRGYYIDEDLSRGTRGRYDLIQNSVDYYIINLNRLEQYKLFMELYKLGFIENLDDDTMDILDDFEEMFCLSDNVKRHFSNEVAYVIEEFSFKNYLIESLEKLCENHKYFK